MTPKGYVGLFLVVLLIGGGLFFTFGNARTASTKSFTAIDTFSGSAKIYKTASCGCCALYTDYFKKQGTSQLEVIQQEDISPLKQELGVPPSHQSCHTVVIGNYFVEGHVPLEAVERLLTEKPDIKGIAVPGMPSGAPGMPGSKSGPLVVYAVGKDGTVTEYMTV